MLTQRFALTLTLIIALAAGCGGLEQAPAWQGYDQNQSGKADKVPAPATVLTTADNGKTLQVQPGDRVQVELASNPTTGFAWHLAKSSLVLESSDYIPDQPAQVGSGGIERLVLQVPASAAPGSIHELRLDYYRSWEGPSSAVETFKVTLIVPAAPGPMAHKLTTADNGKTLQVQPGDRVQVELASNPTTGFAWHLAKSSLVLESSDYIPDQPAQVGSGGTERLVLRVPTSAAPGSIHELRLDYYRSWEGPSSAVETFKVTLIVP